VRERALRLGAEDALVVDATERFYSDCITKAILANACYNGYYLSTPRGRGLMLAFDTPSTDFRAKLWKAAFDAGLLCLPLRDKSIRFRPPLIFSNDNVDSVIETLDEAIKKVK